MAGQFWAAISGAVVGGLIAALLQLVTLKAAASERRQNRLDHDQAEARSLLFKVVKLESDIQNITQYFRQMQENAKKHDMPFNWRTCMSLANLPREVEFSASEKSVLLKAKDNDLFNDLLSIDQVHAGILHNLALYRKKREELTNILPAEMDDDIVGTAVLDDELRRRAEPKAAELDHLLNQLLEDVARAHDAEMTLTKRLTQVFNAAYSLGIEASVKEESKGGEVEI